MSIYDINFNNKAIELSPPDKRNPKLIGLLKSFMAPVVYLKKKYLFDYRVGNTYSQFNPMVVISGPGYFNGALVMYKQVVYESQVDGNRDIPPSANWAVYLPSFIGVETRVKFNGQLAVLTFALNQYFLTNYRQPGLLGWSSTPDSTHTLYSDIYIVNDTPSVVGFLVGATAPYCSNVTAHDTGDGGYAPWNIVTTYAKYNIVTYRGRMYMSLTNGNNTPTDSANWLQCDTIGYSQTFALLNNFTIYMPVAQFPLTSALESDVRNFVDRIIPVGLFYDIKNY